MTYDNSWTGIANEALAMIGTEQIQNLDGVENTDKFVNLLLPSTIEDVFSSYQWNCARKRVVLDPLVDSPPYGYSYYFQFPDNLARIIRVSTNDYTIEGKKILTDEETINLEYTALPSTPDEINPPKLKTAIVLKLASLLATPLAGNLQQANNLEQKYQYALNEAKTIDNHNLSPEFDSPFGTNLWTSR